MYVKYDMTKPLVTFSAQSGAAASSHSVTLTASDSTSKLAASQKIKYKWSTSSECGTAGFTEKALSPTTA